MKLGDHLVAAKLVTEQQVQEALQHQMATGLRLGEALIAIGAIERRALESILHRVPAEPRTIAETGIDETDLLVHALKIVLLGQFSSVPAIAEQMRLPRPLVGDLVQLAVRRSLLRATGERDGATQYLLTESGQQWAQQALENSRYAGPVPVPLREFVDLVERQKVRNSIVGADKLRDAVKGLVIEPSFLEKIGPALNSGKPLLLYGPPGNGKTSVARRFAEIFNDPIFLPYAVDIGGQVMRVYDPNLHIPVDTGQDSVAQAGLSRAEQADARWVLCRRPFVVAGGELTLDMLELQFDPVAKFYEAPLHIKALGGCFVIDDFGRQIVQPRQLLNRWIVPMENWIDYLKLRNGKTFSVPFEAMLVFSTNLEPEELMDPAFLRRLPYKIEVGAPSLDVFREILQTECNAVGLELNDESFEQIIRAVTGRKQLPLACYQPRFIVEQVVA
ncbi:MAG: hypothetical protein VW257_08100, partial [Quisquiliibacterium sp.]